MFQSRLGFSGRLDNVIHTGDCFDVLFQSRLGFSGRLDRIFSRSFGPGLSYRFNPVLGFLVVSTGRPKNGNRIKALFQSRLGFSGRLDLSKSATQTFGLFQSRLGFSGRLDGCGEHLTLSDVEFQSRLGFSGRLDSLPN